MDNLIQKTITGSIPISQHMGYEIIQLTPNRIEVAAPLENNINIHGTAFAGSIYSVATLTGWALMYYVLQDAGYKAELVLAEANIRYRSPIKENLRCQARLDEAERLSFLDKLQQQGRSRLVLEVVINREAAVWTGKLAARL